MIHESGSSLDTKEKAKLEIVELSDTDKVKKLFIEYPNELFSAEDVHRNIRTNSLLSSIRRVCTDLKTSGFLTKHRQEKKPGKYGIRIVTYSHDTEPVQTEIQYWRMFISLTIAWLIHLPDELLLHELNHRQMLPLFLKIIL